MRLHFPTEQRVGGSSRGYLYPSYPQAVITMPTAAGAAAFAHTLDPCSRASCPPGGTTHPSQSATGLGSSRGKSWSPDPPTSPADTPRLLWGSGQWHPEFTQLWEGSSSLGCLPRDTSTQGCVGKNTPAYRCVQDPADPWHRGGLESVCSGAPTCCLQVQKSTLVCATCARAVLGNLWGL